MTSGTKQLEGAAQHLANTAWTNDRKASVIAKSIFDFAIAFMLLPILAPIIGILYAAARLDGGPGFYGHERVGRNGKRFKCWKIRSMVPDAQAVLAKHLANDPEAKAEWERDFKLLDDPRITPLGAFLRKTSLDELPQIWNVLRGDMSFVGPRPVTSAELLKYAGYEWCYLSAKPGITGLWQVSGRNDVDYETRVRMDAQYRMNRSLLGDIGIMVKTVGAGTGCTGR